MEIELLVLLRNKKGLDEKQAAFELLKTNKRDRYFNNLKNKLKKSLINHVIINPSVWADTELKKLHDKCYKEFTIYRILLAGGNRMAGIEMAYKILPKLLEAEIYGLSFLTAMDIQFHHSSMKQSAVTANKYRQIAKEQSEMVQVLGIVKEYHCRMAYICNSRQSYTPKIVAELTDAAKQVEPYLSLNSPYLNRLIYNVIIARFSVEYDYGNMLHYCNEALDSLKKDAKDRNSIQFAYLQKKLPALIGLGKLKEAKEVAKKAKSLVEVGKFNWHLISARRIVACLHGGDYQEAYEVYKAHLQHYRNYGSLSEYWLLLRGYIYFLIKAGYIKPYADEKFNLGKFLNETPTYSKDKSGNHINILIIQILIQMQREQYGKIIDRIEALEAYARAYTRDPETIRANLLIKMIVKMEKASFHRAGTERKTKKLLEKLSNAPLKPKLNLGIEIIPYERIWEFMLDMLENRFRAVKLNKPKRRKGMDKGSSDTLFKRE